MEYVKNTNNLRKGAIPPGSIACKMSLGSSSVYRWVCVHAMFDVTFFPAFVGAYVNAIIQKLFLFKSLCYFSFYPPITVSTILNELCLKLKDLHKNDYIFTCLDTSQLMLIEGFH